MILEYTRGMSKADFLKDRKTQQAVLMNFMTIGEAAVLLKNDHSAFIAEHAEVPWNKMRGMRNILTHGAARVAQGRDAAARGAGAARGRGTCHQSRQQAAVDEGDSSGGQRGAPRSTRQERIGRLKFQA